MTGKKACVNKLWPKCNEAGLIELSPFHFTATAAHFLLSTWDSCKKIKINKLTAVDFFIDSDGHYFVYFTLSFFWEKWASCK